MDLAVAAMRLPPGVILDGEAVVYVADADGRARISFAAAQSRALSRPRRARELADQHPATYVAFDVLTHPAAGFPDLRPRPYSERRQVLLDVLADVGPPIEPVWSTTDRSEALLWHTALEGTGMEIVAKPLRSAYAAGRIWSKVQHADTVDVAVVGFTGTARHPKALAVRLPDGRVALSQRLTTALASVVGPRLVPQSGRAFTKAGDSYTPATGDVVVEVVAGTTRHTVVTVVRLR